jgi:hypothetical protein
VIDYGRLEFQRHPENESRLWEAFDRLSSTPSRDLLVGWWEGKVVLSTAFW